MIIATAISWRDIDQAARMLNWVGFLSKADGCSMRRHSLLLVPSRAAFHRRRYPEILLTAVKTFGKVYSFVPDGADERGWPSSPNFMFWSALTHVEQHFHDDMLWLEPDAIPLRMDAFDVLAGAFYEAQQDGKTFLGNLVKHGIGHMTGVAVYGRNWRATAPKLSEIVKNGVGHFEAFDTYAAEQILPNAKITKLIQHIFHRPSITALSILDPEAVIFHQDKNGALIRLIDESEFYGQAADDEDFGYANIQPEPIQMRFFLAENSNRIITSNGMQFRFDPLENFGGTWRGTYATTREEEAVALDALACDRSSGVTEIDKEAYEARTKKKVTLSPLLGPSKPAYPQAAINQSPAVLVENPSPSPEMAPVGVPPKDIDDVLKEAIIKPAQPEQEAFKQPSIARPGARSLRRQKKSQTFPVPETTS